MSTIAEFSIPAEEFALSETLERLPEMAFTIDRVVAHDTDYVMPFVWASNGDFETLTATLEDDPSIGKVELLTELDEERLYRMEWVDKTQIISYMLLEQEATVQRATAHDNQWYLRVLFPKRNKISATGKYAREHGYSLDVSRIYDVDSTQRVRFDLTDDQQEALMLAVKQGYYDVPRKADQAELADELGVTHQALSERLRRGTKGILKQVLPNTSDEEDANRNL
ncbi:bacterio-opsin activator domain-containing protein [Haladaptatus salinisoli]|uniref:bacterio-opsin activator domain-containing protein n=1 Tax=Haladaptatus salinisoli TaxID=2884876 RepID=UPI001D09F4CE|nr:bacterio-opsin activator domain-containing protein [Haladaptatus salinisoli]